jgi:aspartate/methionine/tyrosine aminotransferase
MTNLHNPSGAGTNADKLVTIGQILRDGKGHVLCCESYLEGTLKTEVRAAVTCGPNLLSVGSLSKIYGLGGVRGGWLIAPEEIIERAKAIGDYISGGTAWPTQTITLFALKNAERLLQRTKSIVGENLVLIRKWIGSREDVSWFEPEGGTLVLLRLPHDINTMRLSNLLREKYSTLIVPGDFFSMRNFIRISSGVAKETLEMGLKNLGTALDELKSSKR